LKKTIDSDKAAILETKTEGWITALRLTALSLQHCVNLDYLTLDSPDSHRFVMDYLFDEVISHLPPATQDFLMKTAILNRLCGPLCDTVAGQDDPECNGQAYLDWLQNINLFTIPLDDRQQWVRYHHLFQELLLLHLENSFKAKEIAALHKKAHKWFAENGYIEEAFYHALEGKDMHAAVRLVAQNRHDLMNREQWHRLDYWISQLPPKEIDKNPELLLLRAWLYETQSRDPDMIVALDKAEALLKGNGLDTSTRLELQGEIDILRARQFWANNDSKRVEILATRAIERVPVIAQYVYGGAKIMLAMAHQVNGNLEQAYAVLNQAFREGKQIFDIYQSRLLTAYCMVSWIAADLTELRQMAGEYLRLAKDQDRPDTESYCRYFSGIAHYQLNELEEAEKVLLPLFNRGYIVNTLGDVHGVFVLALIKLAQGKIAKADEIVESIINKIMDQQNMGLLTQVQAFRVELALRQGRIAEAEAWANRYELEKPGPMWRFLVPELTLAKVRVFQNTPESQRQAADLLHQLLEICQETHNTNCLIQIRVLQAMHHDMQGDHPAALAALERAVRLAEPGGGIRFFVDQGHQIANLLKHLAEKQIAVRFIGKILAAFREAELKALPDTVAHSTRFLSSPDRVEGEQHLTKRELEILTLLSRRFSNREISEKLFISLHTVKKHITNIFLKLNVQTRREAVEKAVGLGILIQQ
jgi:LuxR family maltose regulon positive regulatory protein